MRIGRNIEVLRLAPKQEIAHASAGEVGLISLGPQTLNDVLGGLSLNHHSSSMEYVSKQMEPTAGPSSSPGLGPGSGLILGIETRATRLPPRW